MSSFGLDKSKLKDFKRTKKKILSNIKPSAVQNLKEKKFVKSILKKIKKISGPHKKGVLAGSFARNTNLKDSKDFDIFVLYPTSIDKEEFVEEGLKLGKKVFKGNFWEKAYSQHPYIRGIIDGYKVEIVPAYNIKNTSKLKSAVDRTPFHLKYLKKKLKRSQKDEVRLLKYFLQKINAYGSDSEFEGFSGYLCELLILYYKNFQGVLEAVSNWTFPIYLDLKSKNKKKKKKFTNKFVFIDPVDKTRNVASAVSDYTLSRFIAASRLFLKKPEPYFFNKRLVKNLNYHNLVGKIESLPLLCIEIKTKDLLKDIVWSKLRMFSRKIKDYLEKKDFEILRIKSYFRDGENYAYIIIMLNSLELPKFKYSKGPKVTNLQASDNFIKNTRCILGPYIREDKWYSIKKRNTTFVKPILLDFLFNNFNLPMKIYVDKEIRNLYLKDTDITYYFSRFFLNKEDFLI